MKLWSIFLLLASVTVYASSDHHDHDNDHDHHDEHEHEHVHGSGKAIGPDKAITQVDETLGFSLSPLAMARLEIKFKNALSKDLQLPASALVITGKQTGFYRLRAGFFKFIAVDKVQKSGDVIHISAPDWKMGDRIAISRTDILRVSDIYSTDDAEYGHSH